MSDGMGRELAYLSSHATNRYFIPNWGNICHIVRVHHISKVKVGVKNLLLKTDVERAMAERAAKGL